MARFEIDTDAGTMKRLDDNSGCGVIFIILLVLYFIGSGGSSGGNTSGVEYWKGDKNCPIFVERDDGSMVVFKKSSAREVDKTYSNGDKVFIFTGYEVSYDGYFQEYGWYGVIYNDKQNYYEVFYPQTPTFPDGQRVNINNDYQRKVCNAMMKAAADHEKYKPRG